jgi:hypothetical protein
MVRLDSVKVEIPIEYLKWFRDDVYNEAYLVSNGEVVKDDRVLKDDVKKIPGLKEITIKGLHKKIHIETSGKILREKYYEGLNLNTVEYWLDTINKSGLIKIDRKALSDMDVLRCDVSDNLKVKGSINKYLNALSICAFNDRFLVSRYAGGVVFTKQVKSYKSRMIFYDKYKELMAGKNEGIKVDDFKNVLRCEQNFTSFKTMRKAFRIPNRKLRLLDILQSKEKVNYKTFEEITTGRKLFIKDVDNIKDLKMLCMAWFLCFKCNYDIKEIKDYLLMYVDKRQVYRYMKEIKFWINNIDKIEKAVKEVEEVRELLKCA